jgi:predicted transcriptional regulator
VQGLISYLARYKYNSEKFNKKLEPLEKKEFKRLIKEIGFTSQGRFAEEIGVKASTFTTYKVIPSHIKRITKLALLAKQNGIPLEDIRDSLRID